MTFGHPFLVYSLWLMSPIMLGAVAVRMAREGARREFPMFFNYCVYYAGTITGLLLVQYFGKYVHYFYAYWATNAVGALFGIAVIYEVFTSAFRSLHGLRHLGALAFKWIAVLCIFGAVLLGLSNQPVHGRVLLSSVLNIERTVRFMQIGLLLMLFTASKQIGMSTRSRAFGIALGFGVNASVTMFISMLAEKSLTHVFLLSVLNSLVYVLSMSIWATYFFLPALKESPVILPVTSPLVRWNEAALAFGHSGGRVFYANDAEPFIPHVERLVDRVFDKEMPH